MLLKEALPGGPAGKPGGSTCHAQIGEPCNAGDSGSIPGQEDPLEKGKATHSSILGLPWWLSW